LAGFGGGVGTGVVGGGGLGVEGVVLLLVIGAAVTTAGVVTGVAGSVGLLLLLLGTSVLLGVAFFA